MGVFTQEVWNEVVAGKDLDIVRELQGGPGLAVVGAGALLVLATSFIDD